MPIAVYVGRRTRHVKSVVSGNQAIPNLVTRTEENLKKTFGKLDLTNCPINTVTWCIFARGCMRTSFQMSHIVETCTRDCQNSSFTNAQDIRNILIGSFLEDEQSEEPVILHDQGTFLGEGLDIDEWTNHLFF